MNNCGLLVGAKHEMIQKCNNEQWPMCSCKTNDARESRSMQVSVWAEIEPTEFTINNEAIMRLKNKAVSDARHQRK